MKHILRDKEFFLLARYCNCNWGNIIFSHKNLKKYTKTANALQKDQIIERTLYKKFRKRCLPWSAYLNIVNIENCSHCLHLGDSLKLIVAKGTYLFNTYPRSFIKEVKLVYFLQAFLFENIILTFHRQLIYFNLM